MLVHAFLTVLAADARDQPAPADTLLPITVNEVRRLFTALLTRPAVSVAHVLR